MHSLSGLPDSIESRARAAREENTAALRGALEIDPTRLRLTLLAAGYEPVAAAGKRPLIAGWQNIEATPAVVRAWGRDRPELANTGLRTGALVGIDIDVLDADLSGRLIDLAETMLGPSPLHRVGRAPKLLLCYRNRTPVAKSKTRPRKLPDGTVAAVECLGAGQQLIAFGTHPDTGKPYRWISETPLTVAMSELPEVTPEALAKFRDAADAMIAEAAGDEIEPATPRGRGDPDDLTEGDPGRIEDMDDDALEACLEHVKDFDEYDTYLRVGMACHHQWAGAEDGFDMWCRWASQSSKYDHANAEEKWRSFSTESDRTPATFRWILQVANEAREVAAATAMVEAESALAAATTKAEFRAAASLFRSIAMDEFDRAAAIKAIRAAFKRIMGENLPVAEARALVRYRDPNRDRQAPAATGEVAGFDMKPAGLFYSGEGDGPAIRVSGPFEIIADSRSAESLAWSIRVRGLDRDGRAHDVSITKSALVRDHSAEIARLADAGFDVPVEPTKKLLLARYLNEVPAPERVMEVDTAGWHLGFYVTDGGVVIGDTPGERVILATTIPTAESAPRGNLEGWQSAVASLAVGNSRLALGICAAFGGPLLLLLGEESGGLHLRGGSSIGKTTILKMAASAWGRPVGSWRATDNAMEGMASAANDSLLTLDELGQAEPRSVGESLYLLGNSVGKARLNRDGSSRPVKRFRTLFLSTGEISINDKIGEIPGKGSRAGQEVRILDIPADAGAGFGCFETLHGSPSDREFADRLKAACDSHAGHAAVVFLERLTADMDAAIERVNRIRDEWTRRHVPARVDGQVSRAAARFALVAAAGELAADFGVLPWPAGEAGRGVAACFRDFLAARGGTGALEIAKGIEQVRAFISAHGSSRFEWIRRWGETPEEQENLAYGYQGTRTVNSVGFRRLNSAGQWEHFATSEGYKEIIRGFDMKTLNPALAAAGLLDTGDDGKFSKSIRVPEHGQRRLYHFPALELADFIKSE